MLIYSMSVSADGFIADREGASGWTAREGAVVAPDNTIQNVLGSVEAHDQVAPPPVDRAA